MAETSETELLDLTAGIVAAHVSKNPISFDQIAALIKEVHKTLSGLGSEPEPVKPPAVPIKKSVQKDAITCLECGQPGKVLKRHLTNAHGLSVKEYREKWKLPSDYGPLGCQVVGRISAFAVTTLPGRAGWRGRQPYS